MTSYLYSQNIRIFDYTKFAEPFKEELRANAEQIAKNNNLEIEFVRKSHVRKEDLVKKVLDKRGYHTGLVHILSAMESCNSYKPWYYKKTGKAFLKGTQGKCLHYYFYFIDPYLGHKVDSRYQGETGNNYNIRIEGSRIKHSMGKSSIKM